MALIPHAAGQAHEVRQGVQSAARHVRTKLALDHASCCQKQLRQHEEQQQQQQQLQQQQQQLPRSSQPLADSPAQPVSGWDLAHQPAPAPAAPICAPSCPAAGSAASSNACATARVEWLGWLHAHSQLVPVATALMDIGPLVTSRRSAYAKGRCAGGLARGHWQRETADARHDAPAPGGSVRGKSKHPVEQANRTDVRKPESAGEGAPRCSTRLTSALLLDSLPAVMGALGAGVDAACMLLQVDALVAGEV